MLRLASCLRACACLLLVLATGNAACAEERPHILYVTADDLGWKDVGGGSGLAVDDVSVTLVPEPTSLGLLGLGGLILRRRRRAWNGNMTSAKRG